MKISQALKLKHGDKLINPYYKNADGTSSRWKVVGKVKIWKRTKRFRVPIKRGLYISKYSNNDNVHEFKKVGRWKY